ncbi:MAG: ABC transporter permease [Chloroflexota bacterium]|nr:ABC transporter permease [Chloroflexota bacterium]
MALRPARLIGAASVAAFVIAWQAAASTGLLRADLVSSPVGVISATARLIASGELGRNAVVTIEEFVLGFVPSVAVGLVLGIVMGLQRRLRYLLDPLLMALYAAPLVALIPILVIWFGVGEGSKVAVVFLSALFPVLVNAMAGVEQVEAAWMRAVRAFGGSELDVVRKAILPGALPAFMAGIRLGLGRGIIGVIVGEIYVSVRGIGSLMNDYSGAGRTAELIALVWVTALCGFAGVAAMRWWEERVSAARPALEL